MDPTANLEEQLRIARKILNDDEAGMAHPGDVRLAELVLSLDEWIAQGGFLPVPWGVSRRSGRRDG